MVVLRDSGWGSIRRPEEEIRHVTGTHMPQKPGYQINVGTRTGPVSGQPSVHGENQRVFPNYSTVNPGVRPGPRPPGGGASPGVHNEQAPGSAWNGTGTFHSFGVRAAIINPPFTSRDRPPELNGPGSWSLFDQLSFDALYNGNGAGKSYTVQTASGRPYDWIDFSHRQIDQSLRLDSAMRSGYVRTSKGSIPLSAFAYNKPAPAMQLNSPFLSSVSYNEDSRGNRIGNTYNLDLGDTSNRNVTGPIGPVPQNFPSAAYPTAARYDPNRMSMFEERLYKQAQKAAQAPKASLPPMNNVSKKYSWSSGNTSKASLPPMNNVSKKYSWSYGQPTW